MITALIILIIIGITEGFIIWNLFHKVEIYEDDILYKEEYITKINKIIKEWDDLMSKDTIRQAFENDDEVGVFFNNMKTMTLTLSAYSKSYSTTEGIA